MPRVEMVGGFLGYNPPFLHFPPAAMNAFAQALSAALQYAIVSREISAGDAAAGFVYREAPAFEKDSGWRFFSGAESDEFCEDAANFDTLPLSQALELCPEAAALMKESAGAWEWDDDAGRFQAAADWQPQD